LTWRQWRHFLDNLRPAAPLRWLIHRTCLKLRSVARLHEVAQLAVTAGAGVLK
jgi:hypothetical protein